MLPRPARFAAIAISLVAATLAPASAVAAPDPGLPDQWALNGDGPMGITTAWAQTTGSETIVAVVDTGVDLSHPDLAPNMWRNPGEVAANGLDDDGNGVVDDVHGADFVSGDGDPTDDNGHGTHVAGIIAARGNNGLGIAGVAWTARIMAIKVLDAAGSGNMDAVARGVRYAIAHGARVVNLSLVGPAPGPALQQAIAEAQAAGVLVVAAAGNDHADDDATPVYPASFPAENLIAVTSLGRSGALAPSASWGRATIDLAAPGEAILSTAKGRREEIRSGTSMAAAQVSGALVLLASARPDLGWRELRVALLAGARRSTLPVASGRLDVAGALRQVVPAARWRTLARRPAPATSRPGGNRSGPTRKRATASTKRATKPARRAGSRVKPRGRSDAQTRGNARTRSRYARVRVALPR